MRQSLYGLRKFGATLSAENTIDRMVINSHTKPSQYFIAASSKAPTIGSKDSPFSKRKVLVSVRPCLSTWSMVILSKP